MTWFGVIFSIVLLGLALVASLITFFATNPRDARKRTLAQTRQGLDGLINTIARDFPAELAALGGRTVLEEPASVRTILRDLLEPAAAILAPAESVPSVAPEPSSVRGKLFTSMLGSLAEALRRVESRES